MGEHDRGNAHLHAGRSMAPSDECRLPRPQHHGERGKAVAVHDSEEIIRLFIFDYNNIKNVRYSQK